MTRKSIKLHCPSFLAVNNSLLLICNIFASMYSLCASVLVFDVNN